MAVALVVIGAASAAVRTPRGSVLPRAVDDRAITSDDAVVRIAVLSNDVGTHLRIASLNTTGLRNRRGRILIRPTVGRVWVNRDRTVSYDPRGRFERLKPGQSTTDTFRYRVTDRHHVSAWATVRVRVFEDADRPIARPDVAVTDAVHPVVIHVLRNDSDPDGRPLHISSVDAAGLKGKVTVNRAQTITYDPNGQFGSLAPGALAHESFRYRVSDGRAVSGLAPVTVCVKGVASGPVLSGVESAPRPYRAGDPPVVVSSTILVSDPGSATLAGASVSITVGYASGEDHLNFVNRSGITGSFNSATGVLTLSGLASLANYQAALRSVTYSDANGGGASTATRTVSFQVADPHGKASNTATREMSVTRNPPPTVVDDTASTDSLHATNISVLANDSDSDGDPLTVSAIDTTGTLGTVSINPDNTIHYDPNGQFSSLSVGQTATDTFKYKANDGFSDSAWATVTVTVTGAGPVLSGIESSTLSGYRAQDPAVAITSTLAVSDPDSATLASATVSITSGFVSGSDQLNFVNQNGIAGSFNSVTGVLSLSGVATVAQYENALRSVTFSNSSSSATTTSRTIAFQVNDGASASNTQSRTVSVGAVNQAPTAGTDNYSAVGNTTLGVGTSPSGPAVTQSGTVLSNDSDPDSSSALSVTAGTIPTAQGGSVTMHSDGTFTYVPAQGFSGADSFTYTVTDSDDAANPKSATGTVNISVGTVVWYVDNSLSSAGDGRSTSPFNTLAAANAKVGSGDVLFLYQGSGNYTGGTAMKSNEQLIGQPNGLTVSGHQLIAAGGSNPTITNSSGDGIDLASGTTIRRVNVSSPSGAGIAGTNISTADIGSSMSISGTGTQGFTLSGGSGNVTMAADISNSAAHSVDIESRTGGTTTVSGSVNDSGTGTLLNANTGATVALTGGITASTGTHPAFTATGGGTVDVTGSTNTLATTTAAALDVESTNIGSSGLTFESISAGTSSSGPSAGIILHSTGTAGGLTVTGTGAAGSGGTIQKATSTGAGGGDVSLLNAGAVSLTDMNIQTASNDGIYASELPSLTVASSTFTSNGSDGVFELIGTVGSTTDNTSGTFNIHDNTLTGTVSGPPIQLNLPTTGTVTGHVKNNTIGNSGVTNSGSAGGDGILLQASSHGGTVTADISNNTIRQIATQYGIEADAADDSSGTKVAPTLNLTLSSNNISLASTAALDGMTVVSGSAVSPANICMNATSNTSSTSGTATGNGQFDADGMSVVQNNATSGFQIQGLGATFNNGGEDTGVETFLQAHNTLSGPGGPSIALQQNSNTTGFTNASNCPTAP